MAKDIFWLLPIAADGVAVEMVNACTVGADSRSTRATDGAKCIQSSFFLFFNKCVFYANDDDMNEFFSSYFSKI